MVRIRIVDIQYLKCSIFNSKMFRIQYIQYIPYINIQYSIFNIQYPSVRIQYSIYQYSIFNIQFQYSLFNIRVSVIFNMQMSIYFGKKVIAGQNISSNILIIF